MLLPFLFYKKNLSAERRSGGALRPQEGIGLNKQKVKKINNFCFIYLYRSSQFGKGLG